MRKFLYLLVVPLLSFSQQTYVPDDAFEQALIDLNIDKLPPNRWISDSLVKEINKCLDSNQQALLFLNRRGYAPLALCKKCGYRAECNNCSSWLVMHQSLDKLLCHHCGYSVKQISKCHNNPRRY